MVSPEEKTRLLRALLFEQWLRFRFLCEEPDSKEPRLFLRVPEARRTELMGSHPEFLPLLDCLDGREPDAAAAQAAIVGFSRACSGEVATGHILSDPEFQAEVFRFQQRVEAEAETLDPEISFDSWLNLFEAPQPCGTCGISGSREEA